MVRPLLVIISINLLPPYEVVHWNNQRSYLRATALFYTYNFILTQSVNVKCLSGLDSVCRALISLAISEGVARVIIVSLGVLGLLNTWGEVRATYGFKPPALSLLLSGRPQSTYYGCVIEVPNTPKKIQERPKGRKMPRLCCIYHWPISNTLHKINVNT